MKVVERRLQQLALKVSTLRTIEVVKKIFVPLLVSYCCDTPDSGKILVVQRDAAVKIPCACFIVNGKYIVNGRTGSERSLKESNIVSRKGKGAPKKRPSESRYGNDRVEERQKIEAYYY